MSLLEVKTSLSNFRAVAVPCARWTIFRFPLPRRDPGRGGRVRRGQVAHGCGHHRPARTPGPWPRARLCWRASVSTIWGMKRCATSGAAYRRHLPGPADLAQPLYTWAASSPRPSWRTCRSARPRRASGPSSCCRTRAFRRPSSGSIIFRPVLGRHAPARGDCPGAGGRAQADRGRRGRRRRWMSPSRRRSSSCSRTSRRRGALRSC